jgi:hypothetical protein
MLPCTILLLLALDSCSDGSPPPLSSSDERVGVTARTDAGAFQDCLFVPSAFQNEALDPVYHPTYDISDMLGIADQAV